MIRRSFGQRLANSLRVGGSRPTLQGGAYFSSLCLQHFAEADEGEAEEEQAGRAHVQQLWPEFVQSGAAEDDALAVDGVLGCSASIR